jgi:N-acetylglucosaminyldiphosphoundecaprenol N-acetyl-beta-D-mannosaminyltransferase
MLQSQDVEQADSSPATAPLAPIAPITREDLIPFLSQGMTVDLAATAKVPPRFGRSEDVVAEKPNIARPSSSSILWPEKKDVLGVEISLTNYDELARLFIAAAKRREPALATFLAVHAVVTAALDPSYRYRINAFDVVGADGQPVKWALNTLHKARMSERVCGPSMMLHLCEKAADAGVGIYLYGSTEKTLAKLKANLEDQFPTIQIVGTESPPFRPLTPEENEEACDRINASGAGLVFVGLGCPRQDVFAHQNRNRIKAVQLCVGAAFDFHAGNKKMAPAWMQKYGLEWTYRMLQEPRRLWKRYLVTNTAFILLMTRRMVMGR